MKQSLLSKLMAGTASEVELRMLKAICMNDGDRPCRNAVVMALKERKATAPDVPTVPDTPSF